MNAFASCPNPPPAPRGSVDGQGAWPTIQRLRPLFLGEFADTPLTYIIRATPSQKLEIAKDEWSRWCPDSLRGDEWAAALAGWPEKWASC